MAIGYTFTVDILLLGRGYLKVSEVPMVFHIGKHLCVPKQNTKKYKKLVREAVVRNTSAQTCNIQQTEVGEEIEAGNVSGAYRRVLKLSYNLIRSKKANLDHERNLGKHSLGYISITKLIKLTCIFHKHDFFVVVDDLSSNYTWTSGLRKNLAYYAIYMF